MALTDQEIRAIYDAGFEAVRDVIRLLERRIEEHERRITALEAILAKNSRNSSKPPSSDMFKKPRSLRPDNGRPSGGQPGHEGSGLKQSDTPDHVVKHAVDGLCQCERNLRRGTLIGIERRQVFDLPNPKPLEVTEHQAEIRECACGMVHTAAFPAGVNAPVQYGPRVKAVAAYLSAYQLMPQKRTMEALSDLFGANMSQGTLNTILKQAHTRLEATEDAIAGAIRASPVMHADETGMFVGGKRFWELAFGTPRHTLYVCHPKRGGEALTDSGMLAGYTGRVVHDGYESYFGFAVKHGLCNAHHVRELRFVKEDLGQRWAGTMIGHLCRIKKTVDRAKISRRIALAPDTIARYRKRYEKIIANGYRVNPWLLTQDWSRKGKGRRKQSPARNLLDRLHNRADETLAFMYDIRVPFDNNLAERDLRMTKVKQKISGCFRSMAGAHVFCRMRSYVSTVRKHGYNVLEYLRRCFDPTVTQPVLIGT